MILLIKLYRKIHFTENFLRMIFPAIEQVTPQDTLQDTPQVTPQFRKEFVKISERIREEFGSEVAKTFEIITEQPDLSAQQIADKMGKSARSIEKYIAKLKAFGAIERKGPKLGGYWQINESKI